MVFISPSIDLPYGLGLPGFCETRRHPAPGRCLYPDAQHLNGNILDHLNAFKIFQINGSINFLRVESRDLPFLAMSVVSMATLYWSTYPITWYVLIIQSPDSSRRACISRFDRDKTCRRISTFGHLMWLK